MLIAKQGAYDDAKFSPDGARVVVDEGIGARRDLWLYDIKRETMTRLTFESDNFFPVGKARFTTYDVSPDGKQFLTIRSERLGERIEATTDWTTLLKPVPAER